MCSLSSSAESCREGGSDGGVIAMSDGAAMSEGAGAVGGREGDKVWCCWSAGSAAVVAVVGSAIVVSSEASPLCPNGCGCGVSVVLVGAAVDEEAAAGSVNVKVFVVTSFSKDVRSCSDQLVISTDDKSCLRISSVACGWFDERS